MSRAAPREGWRRALHLASGTLALAAFLPPDTVTWGFAALLGLALLLEVVRLAPGPGRPGLHHRLDGLFRPDEQRALSGATLLAIGYALAWVGAPGTTAARAIVVTAAADPAAAAVGTRLARGTEGKTWYGTGAALGAGALVLLATGLSAGHALLVAAAAAAAERLPWRGADNVAIPLAAMAMLRMLG